MKQRKRVVVGMLLAAAVTGFAGCGSSTKSATTTSVGNGGPTGATFSTTTTTPGSLPPAAIQNSPAKAKAASCAYWKQLSPVLKADIAQRNSQKLQADVDNLNNNGLYSKALADASFVQGPYRQDIEVFERLFVNGATIAATLTAVTEAVNQVDHDCTLPAN